VGVLSVARAKLNLTLREAVEECAVYWRTSALNSKSADTMERFARIGAEAIGLDKQLSAIKPDDIRSMHTTLLKRGLSRKYVQSLHGAVKRVVSYYGVKVTEWPKSPKPPRVKAREPLSATDLERLIGWLRKEGWGETADVAVMMRGTGARINVEVLTAGAISLLPVKDDADYALVRILGKGGHEREVPVVDKETRKLLSSPERVAAYQAIAHDTHNKRWRAAVKALAITSRRPSPHAVRHYYATSIDADLRTMQELLGHADPATTAKYMDVNAQQKLNAVRGVKR
jgi:site-specific recombinase XerC